MSDYAALRELYYEALQMIPPEGGAARGGTTPAEGRATPGERQMSEGLRRDLEAYGGRNQDPNAEPALMRARTQAEWHQAQQALVLAETPPEELAMAMGVSDGVEPSKQQGERMHEQRAKDAAEPRRAVEARCRGHATRRVSVGGCWPLGAAAGLHPGHCAGTGARPDPAGPGPPSLAEPDPPGEPRADRRGAPSGGGDPRTSGTKPDRPGAARGSPSGARGTSGGARRRSARSAERAGSPDATAAQEREQAGQVRDSNDGAL